VPRFLLDTNIVSEASKLQPSRVVDTWLLGQADDDVFISTLSIAGIWRGILEVASGRRRHALGSWFVGAKGPSALFSGRVLPFDQRAAVEWARIMAAGTAARRPRSPIDMIVAATAVANGCIVVTANERHFQGVVEFFNPLRRESGAYDRENRSFTQSGATLKAGLTAFAVYGWSA
jgi:predicted nucleic acid-binding protein